VSLDHYRRKRDFRKTPEPQGGPAADAGGRRYVIQKHAARRLHYDFRLELNGVLKSWAVPKGPSLDPRQKRLAVEVEDHPLGYGDFEGVIPPRQYGAGTVLVWDLGFWEPEGDPEVGLEKGNLKFILHGQKLTGRWALVRITDEGDKKEWLLIKHQDDAAVRNGADTVLERQPESVLSGRKIDEIAADRDRIWQSGRAAGVAAKPGLTGIDPSKIPQAVRAAFPEEFLPQLAGTADHPPDGEEWLHEIKYDGYRLTCHIQAGQVRLITRNQHDWTDRFNALVLEAARLPVRSAILDGEVTVLRPDGTTDFQALQNHIKGKKDGKLIYYLFDLPYCEGYDLSAVPLIQRKQLLKQLMQSQGKPRSGILQVSGEIQGQGQDVFHNACLLGVEGIISKKSAAAYEQRRAASWLKIKCTQRQEFVIGGYSGSNASPGGLRSLLVGYFKDQRLIYAGKVGTGFSVRQRSTLKKQLDDERQTTAPFDNPPRGKDLHWSQPRLVAEIAFSEWTQERVLRHPVFKGLREDKPAGQVVLESQAAAPSRAERSRPASKKSTALDIAGVRLTHPDRVLYPEFGLTKEKLARFYERIADWILPHIRHRPLTIVRCPQGSTEECFYQKHFKETLPEQLKAVRISEGRQERNYIYIEDLPGLIALVQISVLELHPWGSRIEHLENPDTLVFDLDPDPELEWEYVVQTAWHLRGILQGFGLSSYVKTSGGKGLHVQVPVAATATWDEAKRFAQKIAVGMAAAQPRRYTANVRKAQRKGKIYIDYLRNARGATSVAPYSTRARPGAPVSMPLHWEELSMRTGPDAFTVENVAERLERLKDDPWQDYIRIPNAFPEKDLPEHG